MIKLINGDCLEENHQIEDGAVDLILTDLPFGTMKMKEKKRKLPRPTFLLDIYVE